MLMLTYKVKKAFTCFFICFVLFVVGKHRKTVGKFSFHDPQHILQHPFCHVIEKKTHFLHFYRLLTTFKSFFNLYLLMN